MHENRQLGFLTRKYAPPLSTTESYVMGEISHNRLTTASQISQAVPIEKSTLSRMLKSLKNRHLVSEQVSATDKRTRFLTFTSKGEELFAKTCQIRSVIVAELARNLLPEEANRFFKYFGDMADNLGAPAGAPDNYAGINRHQLVRLSKAIRILSDSFLGCGLPIYRFQILHFLYQAGDARPLSELRRTLPYEASVLTRLVFSLQKQGFLRKFSPAFDRRHRHLGMSSDGRMRFKRILEICTAEIKRGLSGFRAEELADFLRLHEKLCSVPSADSESLPGADSYLTKRLKTLAELRRARAFLVQEIAAGRVFDSLPDTLLAESSFCFAILLGERISGVLEVAQKGKQWILAHFVLATGVEVSISGRRLMYSALKDFFQHHPGANVKLPAGSASAVFCREHCLGFAKQRGTISLGKADLADLEWS